MTRDLAIALLKVLAGAIILGYAPWPATRSAAAFVMALGASDIAVIVTERRAHRRRVMGQEL